MTYNHASFIKDAMDGFTMQQTDFPFVCIIVDDASTDGEPEIIRQYLADHFNLEDDTIVRNEETDDFKLIYAQHKTNLNCFFVVLLLKYNHYKKKETKPYFKEWTENVKYVAMCEGDDYWTDSLKLQKQVNALESSAGVVMCCSSCMIRNGEAIEVQSRYDKECIVPTEDIILGGGLWLHTVTYMFRTSLLEGYPQCCKSCHVGDYPLILWASLCGSVFFIPDCMSVYRFQSSGSWTSRRESFDIGFLIKGWRSEINMLKGLDDLSGGKYRVTFNTRIKSYVYDAIINHKDNVSQIVKEFREEIKLFSLKQKLHVLSIRTHSESFFLFFLKGWLLIKRVAKS